MGSRDWTSVRLRKDTAAELYVFARSELKARTLEAVEAEPTRPGGGISLDTAIRVLLMKWRRDKERSDRHTQKRQRENARSLENGDESE